jgi:hypothetical protein
MQKRPPAIRQSEIARAVKGVIATGLAVSRVEIEGNKVVVYAGDGAHRQESPLEAWRRENGAR